MNIPAILNKIGIYSDPWVRSLEVVVFVAFLAILALLVYYFTKKVISRIILKFIGKTPSKWDDVFFGNKFFNRLGLLTASITIGIALASTGREVPEIVMHFTKLLITLASVLMVTEVLYSVNRLYETFSRIRDRPIKIIIQVVVFFLWATAIIIIVSIFTPISVGPLLGGMTAFAAVIMLIFQDSILGFVAGIQLSINNMVRIGDWIQMPSRGVDGNVTEINLTTVKIQNWDKTITTVPTHKLVSESFTNWRGMEESRGRRIKRSVNIDVNSIHYLSDTEIDALRQSALLGTYIEKKIKELEEFNKNRHTLLDERRLTNIGTFREYLSMMMSQNPSINLEMTHMVRQLQSGPTGLPLEVYCFSAYQGWVDYEGVQADIFDHIFAIMPLFGLNAFQYSGSFEVPAKSSDGPPVM